MSQSVRLMFLCLGLSIIGAVVPWVAVIFLLNSH